jgi:glycosyltransferase involved in cell wall biosynthesis
MEDDMVSISLCMIVKNEENTLCRCLESVKDVVDEIIIVDTGSNDRTLEIVKDYTDKIYQFEWIDDFSAARNFAFQQAKMDYVLTMDADDILGYEEKDKLIELKNTLPSSIDAITMKYLTAFDQSGNVLVSLRQVRLVKRAKQFKWHGAVHEYLDVCGNILHSDISVTHKRMHKNYDRNLNIYEVRIKKGIPFSPRDLFYYANELYDHEYYQKAITIYLEFLNTENHWLEDERTAYGKIADCYAKLHDINHINHAIQFVLKSFQLGSPRPEDCCRLGFFFLQKGEPKVALYWFQFATILPNTDYGGIIHHACSTWIPHLQLSGCYSRLGEMNKAYKHIEIAQSFCPNHKVIVKNKSLLESFLKKNSSN